MAGLVGFILVLSMVGGILGGCSTKKADPDLTAAAHFPSTESMEEDAAARQAREEEERLRARAAEEAARAEFYTPDPETGSIAERSLPGDFPDTREAPELLPIYFSYDSDDLLPETKARMTRHVEYLRENPGLSVLLRGHTDERGTEEYNLALGSRRALSVREHLISEGISPDRIHTISMGLYEPTVTADTEEAHSRNRRVEFLVFDTP
ncbi:MAG: OmpA family protein [Candidatus Sumerlaeia bacterium]|nr:OmpA family protein [Candidatus Sumerlaeia bacterium]